MAGKGKKDAVGGGADGPGWGGLGAGCGRAALAGGCGLLVGTGRRSRARRRMGDV